MSLPPLPKSVTHAAVTALAVVSVLTWTGWLTPPWSVAAQQKEESAHVAKTIRAQADALLLLNERDAQRERSIERISGKLDEMAMVLYSLERRTR